MPILGAFAPLVVALVVLLMGLALWVVSNIIARLLRSAPVIGGWVAGRVESIGSSIAHQVITDFDAVTADAGWAFAAVSRWVWHLLDSQSIAARHAVNLAAAAEADARSALAQLGGAAAGAAAAAEHYAAALVAELGAVVQVSQRNLQANINAAIRQTEGYAAAAAAVVEANLQTVETNLQHNINSVGAVLGAQIGSVAAAIKGSVGSLVDQINADLVTAEATAEQDAQAAIAAANAFAAQVAAATAGTAVGALDQAAHDVVVGPWAALLPELGAIAGVLSPAAAGALNLPQVLTESVPASIPGILSLVVPAIGAVTTEVTDCLVPNCDALNTWGRILKGLQDVALWATLLALLQEVVHDPAAAAADIRATVGAVASPVAAGLRDLVGA